MSGSSTRRRAAPAWKFSWDNYDSQVPQPVPDAGVQSPSRQQPTNRKAEGRQSRATAQIPSSRDRSAPKASVSRAAPAKGQGSTGNLAHAGRANLVADSAPEKEQAASTPYEKVASLGTAPVRPSAKAKVKSWDWKWPDSEDALPLGAATSAVLPHATPSPAAPLAKAKPVSRDRRSPAKGGPNAAVRQPSFIPGLLADPEPDRGAGHAAAVGSPTSPATVTPLRRSPAPAEPSVAGAPVNAAPAERPHASEGDLGPRPFAAASERPHEGGATVLAFPPPRGPGHDLARLQRRVSELTALRDAANRAKDDLDRQLRATSRKLETATQVADDAKGAHAEERAQRLAAEAALSDATAALSLERAAREKAERDAFEVAVRLGEETKRREGLERQVREANEALAAERRLRDEIERKSIDAPSAESVFRGMGAEQQDSGPRKPSREVISISGGRNGSRRSIEVIRGRVLTPPRPGASATASAMPHAESPAEPRARLSLSSYRSDPERMLEAAEANAGVPARLAPAARPAHPAPIARAEAAQEGQGARERIARNPLINEAVRVLALVDRLENQGPSGATADFQRNANEAISALRRRMHGIEMKLMSAAASANMESAG